MTSGNPYVMRHKSIPEHERPVVSLTDYELLFLGTLFFGLLGTLSLGHSVLEEGLLELDLTVAHSVAGYWDAGRARKI
ncbi:hypothetical protein L227DRAFT_417527 [Lentinus tigrinus ALCF2SS1-6]|uniref:Uncharacterized protein n=1 Tax=Lentinus tigrinus ALCF2SS1-6 TaxID=1328759 RepID=A0A5C2SHR0_9APHY|nr:hypothetical protein L227DRAFT_417527 [Lentinus tigrinus ALCF2SS1-6]